MKNMLASLYEGLFGVFDSSYELIYTSMYDAHGYLMISLLFVIIPLLIMALFYFAFRYPYGKRWHWFAALAVGLGIVCFSTIGLFNSHIYGTSNPELWELLSNPDSGYPQHATYLSYVYAAINTFMALIVSILGSLLYKQISKLHPHLPI